MMGRTSPMVTGSESSSGRLVLDEVQNLKETANKFFSEGKFEQAIIGYSFAIQQIQQAIVPANQREATVSPQRIAYLLKAGGSKLAEAALLAAVLFSNRAQTYLNLKKNAKALADAAAAAELDPTMFKAWYRKGVACSNLGKPYDAMVALRAAVKLDPSSHEANSLLAEVQYKMGNRDSI